MRADDLVGCYLYHSSNSVLPPSRPIFRAHNGGRGSSRLAALPGVRQLLNVWSRARSSLDVRRAFGLVWASGPRLAVAGLVLQLCGGLMPLLGLLLLQRVVDGVLKASNLPPGTGREAAWHGALTFVALAALVAVMSAALDALNQLVNEAQSQAVTDHVQGVLHRKAVEVDVEFYENAEGHTRLHRAQEEAPGRPSRIVRGLASLGQSTFSLLAIAAILSRLHPMVLPLLALAAVPGVLTRLKFIGILYRWQRERSPLERRASYFHLLLTLGFYAKEVRLFGLGPEFMRRFTESRGIVRRERLQLASRRAIADVLTGSIAALPMFGCLAYAGYRTVQGNISVGELTLYYGAFARGQGSLQGVLNGLLGLHEDNLFLTDVYAFFDLEPKVRAPLHPKPVPTVPLEGLRFENVSFSYPGSARETLRGVDLSIAPGQVVALVGENGSGKTTLIKLLCRLYDPDEGRLSYDGVDVRDFSPDEWRRQISVVFQDYAHYDLSARDNIHVGNLDLPFDSAQIEEAARASGAHEVIEKLPLGYETTLGRFLEEGEELSIGQWQKVAIARAFVRPAPIVVLDEPTAALDPEAEADVFERFHVLMKGRAAILISHRLSTVKMADCIYVMDSGRIVESGSHDELISRKGVYARLFETQAQHYR